jgi:hypothetical protein
MIEASQSDAIAFLMRVCAEAGDGAPPALTHISRVFFAGERVFKLKRAVIKPYLDFSTAELRCNLIVRRRQSFTSPCGASRARRMDWRLTGRESLSIASLKCSALMKTACSITWRNAVP